MPLPLGSPQLDRRDALLLGSGVAVGWWGSHLNPLLPLIAFGLGYLVAALAVLRDTRVWPAAYGIAFGLAAVVRVWPTYPFIVAIVAVLHVLAWLGLGVSLQGYRQRREPEPDLPRTARTLGWPFTHLNPVAPRDPIPLRHAAALALLAGWWAYCITAPQRLWCRCTGVPDRDHDRPLGRSRSARDLYRRYPTAGRRAGTARIATVDHPRLRPRARGTPVHSGNDGPRRSRRVLRRREVEHLVRRPIGRHDRLDHVARHRARPDPPRLAALRRVRRSPTRRRPPAPVERRARAVRTAVAVGLLRRTG